MAEPELRMDASFSVSGKGVSDSESGYTSTASHSTCATAPIYVKSATSKFARLFKAADPPCYTIILGSINP